MMQRKALLGLSAAAVMLTVPLVSNMPVLASLQNAGTVLAQAVQKKPQVQLNLSVAKQVVERDSQGKEKITWQEEGQKVSVRPGDILRYSLSSKNAGDRPVKNLVLTQPIPKGMLYVLNSASRGGDHSAQLTYSIDGGRTFVASPTVQVMVNGKSESRPAPAEAYTHVRWTLTNSLAASATAKVDYQVNVR